MSLFKDIRIIIFTTVPFQLTARIDGHSILFINWLIFDTPLVFYKDLKKNNNSYYLITYVALGCRNIGVVEASRQQVVAEMYSWEVIYTYLSSSAYVNKCIVHMRDCFVCI